LSYSPAVTLFM